MKKVLLAAVNGSYTHTNPAVRCLRASLVKAGFEVVIKEFNLRERTSHIFDAIYNEKADIVGFSCYIWNIDVMLGLACDLKSVRPETCVILGGPEVSFDTERFSSLDYVDCVLCGEGEEKIVEICESFEENKPFPKIVKCPPPKNVMKDEGILYTEEDFKSNSIPRGALLYYESSRGCPFGCAYCLSSVSEGIRMKSVEQTMNDLRQFEKTGEKDSYKIIKFVDRTFNFNPERANEIWKNLLSDEFTKHYHFEICASLLNEESFEILSQFPKGKIQLECGLQSTNSETLSAVSRHINPETVLKNVKRVHDMGNIHIHLDLIAGLPYEGYERFKQSFNEAYFCCDLLQLGFLKLLHGTRLRKDAEIYGIKYKKDAPYTVLRTRWMSYDEISKLSEISETMERFRESGSFDNSISYILENGIRPFELFEGLAGYIKEADGRHLQQISQIDAYRLLYEFASGKLGGDILKTLGKKIYDDYSANEARVMPAGLKKILF